MENFVHHVFEVAIMTLEECCMICILTPLCHFIKVKDNECGLGSLDPEVLTNATMKKGDGFVYINKGKRI